MKRKSKERVFKEDYIPWVQEHGKLPSDCSPNLIERRLGNWRNKNRKWDKLIEFTSQYDPIHKSREQVFIEDFIPWCKDHLGKLPKMTSPDPIEKRLGNWRNKNRKWDKLIEFTSQYDPIRRTKERVFIEDFIPWCKEHPGKLPSDYSPDPIEKRLGKWRYSNRRWDKLIEFTSQYTPLVRSKERVFIEDFIPWVQEHGKLPIATSPDPLERKLGYWRSKNREWDKLTQFSLLVKYSETSDKAKELLEKMIAAH